MLNSAAFHRVDRSRSATAPSRPQLHCAEISAICSTATPISPPQGNPKMDKIEIHTARHSTYLPGP
jgi:hypothetical protein